MTQLQITYFLTAARCLNFTEASAKLYISQSALSQQITSMEKELNMQLFIRSKGKVRLTPAGEILLSELPYYEKYYADILKKAQLANEGRHGLLRIGFLQGETLPDSIQHKFIDFTMIYPQIGIELYSLSFGDLKKQLEEHQLDMIYTVDFDLLGKTDYIVHQTEASHPIALVSKYHPIAQKHITNLSQLKEETFIVMQGFESQNELNIIEQDCRKAGFIPNMRYASSLNQQMLWVELGVGIGFANTSSYARLNPNLVCLGNLSEAEHYHVFAWLNDNLNPSIVLFEQSVLNSFQDTKK